MGETLNYRECMVVNEVKKRMGEFYKQLVTISMSSKMCDHK